MNETSDHAAMGSLGEPAGPEVVDRVTAERLGQPRLRAVDAAEPGADDRVGELEAELAEERAARRKAESEANEMAVLVARVRAQLADERESRAAAEATAAKMAELLAQEHANSRKLEDELRLAWGQVPMVEQREINAGAKPRIAQRARRALRR